MGLDLKGGVVRVLLALAAAAATTMAWAQGAPPPFRIPHVIVNPEYARAPTEADYLAAYPPAALKARISGAAWIHCNVAIDGKVTDCTIISEDPPGLGFGSAAISLVTRIGSTPKTRDGEPVAGDFQTEVRFSPP